VEQLFNLKTILLHMFNAALLLVALYFLLYRPVRKFLRAREEKVAGQLDSAADNQKLAAQLVEERQRQLNGAAQEVADLIKTGEAQGKARADAVVAAAQAEARQLAEKARAQMRTQEQNAQRELYDEAARLSVKIAAMVLEREVTEADHKRLLREFLEKAGRGE